MSIPATAPKWHSLQRAGLFETILSGLVIVIAVAFMGFVYDRTGTGHLGSYPLRIKLADAAGLDVGSEVRLGGIKIGSVSGVFLEPGTFGVVAEIRIRDDLSLPVDSAAAVSSSVMGDIYLSLTAGQAGKVIPPGGELDQKARHAPVGR